MSENDYTVREIRFGEQGRSIYGELYLPNGVERPKLIIYAHEIGCTHTTSRAYAAHLAGRGYAFFAPDFRGGGERSKSEGDTVDMSVLTEVDDLEEIFDQVRGWDFVDGERPVLFGASQGGFVAAIYAGRHPERVSALIELYPAFAIPDAMHKDYKSVDEVPDRYFFKGWLWSGKRYVRDMWDYDKYAETMNYRGPVLIVQGDSDAIVPPHTVVSAAERYENARLHILPGAGHMFSGEYTETTKALIDEFLTANNC